MSEKKPKWSKEIERHSLKHFRGWRGFLLPLNIWRMVMRKMEGVIWSRWDQWIQVYRRQTLGADLASIDASHVPASIWSSSQQLCQINFITSALHVRRQTKISKANCPSSRDLNRSVLSLLFPQHHSAFSRTTLSKRNWDFSRSEGLSMPQSLSAGICHQPSSQDLMKMHFKMGDVVGLETPKTWPNFESVNSSSFCKSYF